MPDTAFDSASPFSPAVANATSKFWVACKEPFPFSISPPNEPTTPSTPFASIPPPATARTPPSIPFMLSSIPLKPDSILSFIVFPTFSALAGGLILSNFFCTLSSSASTFSLETPIFICLSPKPPAAAANAVLTLSALASDSDATWFKLSMNFFKSSSNVADITAAIVSPLLI